MLNYYCSSIYISTGCSCIMLIYETLGITHHYYLTISMLSTFLLQMRASMSQYLSDDDSDSDIEIDVSRHNRFNKFKKSPPKTKTSSTEVVKKKPNPVDEEINEKLELSISDVKVITLLSKYYCE